MDNEELNSLLTTIKNQGEELVALKKEVERLQAKLEKAEGKKAPAVKKEPAAKKPAAAKKAAAKKPVEMCIRDSAFATAQANGFPIKVGPCIKTPG